MVWSAVNYRLPPCEIFVDERPQSGRCNMDRDERLLQLADADLSKSMVRIYRWEEPTVSVGYFQKPDDEVSAELAGCPRVRRVTGGGAILHDDEVTYACVIPASHPLRPTPTELYVIVHEAVIRLAASCGAKCCLRQDARDLVGDPSASEPFLCFLRSDPRDVVLNGHKILGSAQRRRRGTILQHGSILMQASSLTPDLPGVIDLCPQFARERFEHGLPEAIGSAIADEFCLCHWPPSASAAPAET